MPGLVIPLNTSLRIVLKDVALSRGERTLVQNLSMEVACGEALIVTGPNGSGKTTLLRAIAGFVMPDSGQIFLEGVQGDTPLPEALHIIGHRDGLKSALTVRENLELAPLLMGGSGTSLDEASERLAVAPLLDLHVGVLSAGQRRRTALARLLMVARPIWLLDEPTAALDNASQTSVAELIGGHVKTGGIVIAATHLDLGVAARGLCFDAGGGFAVTGAP